MGKKAVRSGVVTAASGAYTASKIKKIKELENELKNTTDQVKADLLRKEIKRLKRRAVGGGILTGVNALSTVSRAKDATKKGAAAVANARRDTIRQLDNLLNEDEELDQAYMDGYLQALEEAEY